MNGQRFNWWKKKIPRPANHCGLLKKKSNPALSVRLLSVNGSSVAPPSWGMSEDLVGATDIPQETVLGFQAADISCKQDLGSPAPASE